jgi:hypothetical protein
MPIPRSNDALDSFLEFLDTFTLDDLAGGRTRLKVRPSKKAETAHAAVRASR